MWPRRYLGKKNVDTVLILHRFVIWLRAGPIHFGTRVRPQNGATPPSLLVKKGVRKICIRNEGGGKKERFASRSAALVAVASPHLMDPIVNVKDL